MTAYVVLLRQVNVAGRNKVPMVKLREALRSDGFADAATYLANGNVVLTSTAGAEEVADDVRGCIRETFGKHVEPMVRRVDELVDVLAGSPFGPSPDDDWAGARHVGFLSEEPHGDDVLGLKMLLDDGFGDVGVEVVGTELHLRYGEGADGPRVSPSALERALGVHVAMRNWRTVAALAEMAGRL
jgi:uncharacterized protein (DUF1697 family)